MVAEFLMDHVSQEDAERLLIEGGRVVGVTATAKQPQTGRRPGFTVRARAVVVACGALMTPVMLLGDPAARRALSRSRAAGSK